MTVLLGREKRRMSVTTERTAVKLWFIDLFSSPCTIG